MKRFRIALGLVAITALAGLTWQVIHHREPIYRGRPLSYWLEEINRADSLEKTVPASNALRAMGTNALPFLLCHIEHKDSRIKTYLAKFCERQAILKLQLLEQNPLLSPSLLAVKELGAGATPLIPDFVKLVEKDDMRSWRGEMGLWAIGHEAKPALEKMCQSTNEHVRATAGLLLARVSVRDDGWSWGWNKSAVSGRKLFGLGSVVTDKVVLALRQNLVHREAAVRRASAEALKRVGTQGNFCKSALMDALNDEDGAVREAAAKALKAIEPQAAVNLDVYLK